MINKSTTQVTYRVVQVSKQLQGDGGGPQSRVSNGGSSVGAESRFGYFPLTTVSDGAVSVQAAGDPGGQLYVMMSPPDVLHTAAQRHQYLTKMDGPRAPRDERRRAQHNEVERRRRDKINNWIVTLSKIIPDCSEDSTKTGASKGGILSKACDYIHELRRSNQRLQEAQKEAQKEAQRIQEHNELCRHQIEELKNENALMRAKLQQRGVVGETAP